MTTINKSLTTVFWLLSLLLGHIDANANIMTDKEGHSGGDTEIEATRGLEEVFAGIVANSLPTEKVYLHLDNTNYYKDDTLWFCAYVVNSDGNTSDGVSKTLYVDLLNPGGDIVDTRVLKIENGRAYGSFRINSIPFYSGFFEIRAYTKYMMNFGPETAYSRVIPVFDAPKKNGDFQKRNIRTYGTGHYKYTRKAPEKVNDFDIRFYPEGGHLVKGIPAKVAFEAMDKTGHPIDIDGWVLAADGDTVASIKTEHHGKGEFSITSDGKPLTAVLKHKDKTKTVGLPEAYPDGYALSVDNISNRDSILITVNRTGIYNRLDTVGVVLTSQGIMKAYSALASSFRKPVRVAFDRKDLSAGVAEVTLIDNCGHKIADRLFFNPADSASRIYINYEFDKSSYKPYEAVNLNVTLSDSEGNPVRSPFSISVRDGAYDTGWNRNVMTDLLLMSDIKGYVADPGYYFASDDSTHRRHLDLLMMVQGWRKYPWESIAGNRKDDLRFKPETEGIEIAGTARNLRNRPLADVDMTAFLMKGDREENKTLPPMDVTKTDSNGRFSFTVNVEDRWKLILNTTRKNKLIDSQIALDRGFVPQPRRYSLYEMEMPSFSNIEGSVNPSKYMAESSNEPPADENNDLSRSADDKSVWIDEVEVKAKRNWMDDARTDARKRAIAYYDVDEQVNALRDDGGYINLGSDIHSLIMRVNPNFIEEDWYGDNMLYYKGKMALIVVDYERMSGPTPYDYFRYKEIRLESIKSISVSEDATMKGNYCWLQIPPSLADRQYGCVVMIETNPEGKITIDGGKGIRKTSFHGYDTPQEFYSPDYSGMPPIEADYRRTLYWNPAVMPDEKGKATVRFHNNSNCSNMKMDVQTVTETGAMGASR